MPRKNQGGVVISKTSPALASEPVQVYGMGQTISDMPATMNDGVSESVTQLTKSMPDLLVSPPNRDRMMKPSFGFAATQPLDIAKIKSSSDDENIEATEENRDSFANALETRAPVAMNGALQSNSREKGKINFLHTQKYKAANVFFADELRSPSGRGVSGQGNIKSPRRIQQAVVENSIEQARKAAKQAQLARMAPTIQPDLMSDISKTGPTKLSL